MGLFSVAETSNGTLLMSGGSNLFAERAEIGTVDTAVGQVTVSGSSTLLETEFDITVGGAGSGELNVVDGGVVSSGYGKIGLLSTNGHSGRILVANAGSTLNLTNALSVGPMGVGSLEVRDGGVVTSNGGGIGLGSNNGIGTVTLSDAGSRWNNSGALLVGGSGQGELLVKSGAVVISDSGQISMAATAPFGSGLVTVTGNGSTWTNQSNLFVGGNEFESKGVGTLEISDGGYVSSKTNATIWETGIVTINGGQLDVGATLTNAGRIFVTELGADIFGNVDIVANGKIETLTGSTAVLHGNVTHNGSQVRTAASSTTQFSGMVTGAGRYLGDGLVKFDDVFRPGNSTSEIEFAGDVEFGANSLSYFELGGLNPGEFDSLDIAGDLSLAGELSVSLWDQFQLESGQEFLIADVNGSLIGQYEGLGEGDWVGQFGGVDLFISYRAGNGNDVGLFSSVPEPGSLAFGILAIMGMAMKRRRRLG
jgi:T5SS/PEP-CTERM-associated repeat protein